MATAATNAATETPKSLGYTMPAEWEAHEATWATFPHNDNTWPERIGGVQKLFAEMIAHISAGEKVHVLVRNQRIRELAQQLIFAHAFANRPNILFHDIPTMDSWIRDYGPTFVVNRAQHSLAMVAWDFNAWGAKYESEEPLSNDKEIPARINGLLGLRAFRPNLIMEGGSLEANGAGAVLTTEQCLLNPNRNPNLTRAQIEQRLCDFLGAARVVWLGDGVEGDDTDGHIDDIARFTGENDVLCSLPGRIDTKNYAPMKENFGRLERAGFRVSALPMPKPIFVDEGRRIPASYANFYVANACVIVPVFNDESDEKALESIARAFPGRRVVGLYATDVAYGFGSWHCLTQQQPAV